MKKLCILLSYVACLSSTFAAVPSPSSDFDDCGRILSPLETGAVAPQSTPQAGPRAVDENISIMQRFLPQADQEQTLSVVDDVEIQSPNMIEVLEASLNLKVYYSEHDSEGISLKRFTTEILRTDYAALSEGSTLELMFIPEIKLQNATLNNVEQLFGNISRFDTIGWIANIRAWTKWWLNPWVWWDPSRYSLDSKNDNIEWDHVASRVTIHITTAKDVTYLASQTRLFLLNGWMSRFSPYIMSITQKTLEHAVMFRFKTVEKPALEAIGFKDVTLGARVNPVTHRLERIIYATK